MKPSVYRFGSVILGLWLALMSGFGLTQSALPSSSQGLVAAMQAAFERKDAAAFAALATETVFVDYDMGGVEYHEDAELFSRKFMQAVSCLAWEPVVVSSSESDYLWDVEAALLLRMGGRHATLLLHDAPRDSAWHRHQFVLEYTEAGWLWSAYSTPDLELRRLLSALRPDPLVPEESYASLENLVVALGAALRSADLRALNRMMRCAVEVGAEGAVVVPAGSFASRFLRFGPELSWPNGLAVGSAGGQVPTLMIEQGAASLTLDDERGSRHVFRFEQEERGWQWVGFDSSDAALLAAVSGAAGP